MKPDMLNEMFDYLKSFMIESYWEDAAKEQSRAIFTTICLMGDIRVDTSGCDNLLHELWSDAAIGDLGVDYDEFENYMVGLIV